MRKRITLLAGAVLATLVVVASAAGVGRAPASTHALASNDSGDATYNSIEGQIQSLTSQRDTLAGQIKAALDAATFNGQALNSAQVQSWLSQAQSLQNQAAALAGP